MNNEIECEEVWKSITGYEEQYEISNLGHVRSLDRKDSIGRTLKGKSLKLLYNNKGYFMVHLCKNGQQSNKLVHILVATHFVPNPNNYEEVSHKDENCENCAFWNLEWTSHKENCQMPLRRKRISEKAKLQKWSEERKKQFGEANKGEKNYFHTHIYAGSDNPRAQKVICEGKVYETIKSCASYYGYKSFCNLSGYLKHPETMPKIWKERGLIYYDTEK